MRINSDSLLFNKESAKTLDSQIELYRKNNTDTKTGSKETSEKSYFSDEVTNFLKSVEDKLKIVDEKVISQSFFEYVKTPTEADKFINHLIKPLKRITPEEELMLFYFLQAAISYTVKFSPENECNLENLIFLAIMLRDDTTKKDIKDSLFDLFIKEDLNKASDKNNSDLILYYNRFCAYKNEKTPGIILKNILKITVKFKPYSND